MAANPVAMTGYKNGNTQILCKDRTVEHLNRVLVASQRLCFFGGSGIDPDMLSELLEILPDLIECAGYSRGLFYIPLRKEKRT
ncbi:hypothetical protein DP804_19550 [Salmonella enterica subsp. enterica]|nr:hypothetical protein [Salmonella enterica subsp. enterica serovar Virchow]